MIGSGELLQPKTLKYVISVNMHFSVAGRYNATCPRCSLRRSGITGVLCV